MIIGFTGTRAGMTRAQKAAVADILAFATEVHHGDCVGADSDFHDLALEAPGVRRIVIHPPRNPQLRAFCDDRPAPLTLDVVVLRPEEYAARNRAIVSAVDRMIACPKEDDEPAAARGQGTWSTVRYARRVRKPLVVCWPERGSW